MSPNKKNRLRKLLRGLFRAEDEEVASYFAPEMTTPDEYSLVACLFKRHGPKPIKEGAPETILSDCLRELCPNDTDDMIEMRVKEFMDYGFLERWNNGDYW